MNAGIDGLLSFVLILANVCLGFAFMALAIAAERKEDEERMKFKAFVEHMINIKNGEEGKEMQEEGK